MPLDKPQINKDTAPVCVPPLSHSAHVSLETEGLYVISKGILG